MHRSIKILAASFAIIGIGLGSISSAFAGPYHHLNKKCFAVKNVAYWDVLNIRSRPHHRSPIVGILKPFYQHGIIVKSGPCVPRWRRWGQRWCKVTHYGDPYVTRGWIKRKFVRRIRCPE